MLGLERGTVKLLAYEHTWEDLGARYCAQIRKALGDLAIRVEHVGSTSVPGLCAKPIIDVAVGVSAFTQQIIEKMELAGFWHRPSHDDTHNMLFVDGEGEIRRAHIHVVIHMSMEWRNYLNFRDYLRTFETVRDDYAAQKQLLAERYPYDRDAYTESKAAFISYHLRKAMVWSFLGKMISVRIDRPIGYVHTKGNKTLDYPINYGYIPGVLGGDGEELDVYCLGAEEPLQSFFGRVIAIVHRADDVEDKLVACMDGTHYSARDVCQEIRFQERYYNTTIEMLDGQILHMNNGDRHGN